MQLANHQSRHFPNPQGGIISKDEEYSVLALRLFFLTGSIKTCICRSSKYLISLLETFRPCTVWLKPKTRVISMHSSDAYDNRLLLWRAVGYRSSRFMFLYRPSAQDNLSDFSVQIIKTDMFTTASFYFFISSRKSMQILRLREAVC